VFRLAMVTWVMMYDKIGEKERVVNWQSGSLSA
jgi:hypothetical protein